MARSTNLLSLTSQLRSLHKQPVLLVALAVAFYSHLMELKPQVSVLLVKTLAEIFDECGFKCFLYDRMVDNPCIDEVSSGARGQ